MEQICRICGCTESRACHHPELDNCWWVEKDLCSHCAMIASGEIKKEDVTYLCPDISCAYHACMSDDCQYEEMRSNGADLLERKCGRSINKTN